MAHREITDREPLEGSLRFHLGWACQDRQTGLAQLTIYAFFIEDESGSSLSDWSEDEDDDVGYDDYYSLNDDEGRASQVNELFLVLSVQFVNWNTKQELPNLN